MAALHSSGHLSVSLNIPELCAAFTPWDSRPALTSWHQPAAIGLYRYYSIIGWEVFPGNCRRLTWSFHFFHVQSLTSHTLNGSDFARRFRVQTDTLRAPQLSCHVQTLAMQLMGMSIRHSFYHGRELQKGLKRAGCHASQRFWTLKSKRDRVPFIL